MMADDVHEAIHYYHRHQLYTHLGGMYVGCSVSLMGESSGKLRKMR